MSAVAVLPHAWSERLSRVFVQRFPVRDPQRRALGREGEHPVVHPDGTAADISVLWPLLAADGDFKVLREGELIVGLEGAEVTYSAEVGKGTIEVIVGPCPHLHGIRDRYEHAMERLVRATDACGLVVLGYGIQPSTPATAALMTGKQRYGVLHEVLGDAWLWFAVTASDQVHVDVARDEVIAATNLANLTAPVAIALLANSPVQGGVATGVCSTREATMNAIHAGSHRHGMPSGPSADVADWIERTLDMDYLMHRQDGRNVPTGASFRRWLDAAARTDEEAFDGWLWHEHYIWNSARPRTAHGTVELRAPCQQPWSDHMAAAALGAGLVCGHRAVAAFLDETFDGQAWPALAAWHRAAVRDGLAAPEPVPGMITGILERARDALAERGHGEEVFLDGLFDRVARGRNPAQDALDVFERGGVTALVDHARVR